MDKVHSYPCLNMSLGIIDGIFALWKAYQKSKAGATRSNKYNTSKDNKKQNFADFSHVVDTQRQPQII